MARFKEYDFITLDFETANHDANSACALGIVCVRGLSVVDSEYYLIKPPTDNFEIYNTNIHGITYDDVKNCNDFTYLYDDLIGYILNSRYVISHNASFDMNVLGGCVDFYALDQPEFIYLDSIDVTAPMRDCKNSLAACADFFDVKVEEHHNALSDAMACAEIVTKSIAMAGNESLQEYLLAAGRFVNKRIFSDLLVNKRGLSDVDEVVFSFPDFSNDSTKEPSDSLDYKDDAVIDIPFFEFESIELGGKKVVLTGVFSSSSRKGFEDLMLQSGAKVLKNITQKTNYLIVGSSPEERWKHGNYGSKIEKAISWNDEGAANIKILRESDVLDFLNR